MKLVENFYNKIVNELDSKYFPNLEYYRDNKHCERLHYNTELFNNGCLSYKQYIKRIAKNCNDSKYNIKKIVDKHILKEKVLIILDSGTEEAHIYPFDEDKWENAEDFTDKNGNMIIDSNCQWMLIDELNIQIH